MTKETIINSTDDGATAQVDSILTQTGETLREGKWKATVVNNYSDDGRTLLLRVVSVNYEQPQSPG